MAIRTPERSVRQIPVFTLANGHELRLSVHELTGAQDGPVLGLIAGIHGDEPLGVEMLRLTLDRVELSSLRGSILALSVANPYALQAGTRNTPVDMTNLNRVFPGDPNGTFSEQLAHTIRTDYLPRVQYLVDYHSGGTFPTVEYMYLEPRDVELSKAYGCEYLYQSPGFVGTLTSEAKKLDIPSLVSELGGGGRRTDYYLEKGVDGTLNVMRQLKMLPEEPTRFGTQWIFDELSTIRPHQGGTLISSIRAEQLNQRVPGGTVLGEVRNSATFDVLETIRAPFESSILILAREGITTIDPGDYGYMIGNAASARPA